MYTVMGQSYRGSGRPNMIRVVDAGDDAEIDRLKAHGFNIVRDYTEIASEDEAWNQLTYSDDEGFIYWK